MGQFCHVKRLRVNKELVIFMDLDINEYVGLEAESEIKTQQPSCLKYISYAVK